jgi:hypothetical protein
MKHKKIKSSGVLFLIMLMILANSIISAGAIVNKQNDEKIKTTSDKTITIGTIYIGNHVVTVDANDVTVDLGRGGGDLTIKVNVKFRLVGTHDHGYAYLYYNGVKKAEADYGEDYRDTTLQFTIYGCSPGDSLYKIVLEGRYTDWYGTEDWSKSKTAHVTIQDYDPLPKLYCYGATLVKGSPGYPGNGDLVVQNNGEEHSTLDWKIEFGGGIDRYSDSSKWRFTNSHGYNLNEYMSGETVFVKFDGFLPLREQTIYFAAYFYVYADYDNDGAFDDASCRVDITIKVEKPKKGGPRSISLPDLLYRFLPNIDVFLERINFLI